MGEQNLHDAVVLAAGRGTRLGRVTRERPKALLPVIGKPILVRIIDRLWAAGVRRVVVVTGDWGADAENTIREATLAGGDLIFVRQPEATGTVDALQLAAPFVQGRFFLTAVDTLTSAAHLRRLGARGAIHPDGLATLSLLPATPEQIRHSAAVALDGERITTIQEKPDEPFGDYAAVMVYAFSRRIFTYLEGVRPSERGEREIASAIGAGIRAGEWVDYAVLSRRQHLTDAHDLLRINLTRLEAMGPVIRHTSEGLPNGWHAPVYVADGAVVGEGARLGPRVYLERGAVVEAGATVSDTVVLAGGRVKAGETCAHLLIGAGVRVNGR